MTDNTVRHPASSSSKFSTSSFVCSAILVVTSGPVITFGILSSIGSFTTNDATSLTALSIGIVTFCIIVSVFNYGILPLAIVTSSRRRWFYPMVISGVSFLLTALILDMTTYAPNKPIWIDITEIIALALGITLPSLALLLALRRQTELEKDPNRFAATWLTMSSSERLAASSALHEEGVITDDEFVAIFMREILDGELTSLADSPIKLPKDLANDFRDMISHLESNNYIDTNPYQRESTESLKDKAERFKQVYANVFAEIRAYYAELEA